MPEFEWKEPIKLEDGSHKGLITKVEHREQPYNYMDIYIRPEGVEFEIKYGAPAYLSTKSKLGKLLALFTEPKIGESIDPAKVLTGKEVTFMTITEKTDKGEFVNIVDGSIKPTVTTEEVKS